MRQSVRILLLLVLIFVTSRCGWHLCDTTSKPSQFKKLILDSKDPNGPLSQSIRNKLHLSKIKALRKNNPCHTIPLFRIIDSSLSRNVVSIFHNGHTAEYQIVLSINAIMLIPDKNIFPINVKVCRSFFDSPYTALAKNTEQQTIINEMYDQAAEQLIRKLLNIQFRSQYSK